jgi:hypothetical protein
MLERLSTSISAALAVLPINEQSFDVTTTAMAIENSTDMFRLAKGFHKSI